MKKKTCGEFFYLSFAVTRLKIGFIEKMQKNDIEIAQNGPPCPRPPEPIIQIGLVKKKINSITDWTERPREPRGNEGNFLHFRIPDVTKSEKNVFSRKKSRFFDKLIIKNVQS